jgi:hypothetical protein
MSHEFDNVYPSSEEDTNSVQAPEEPKPKCQTQRGPGNQFNAFKCTTSIQCDMVNAESVQARIDLLEEHLRTRLNHTRPGAVKACAVLVNSSDFSGPPAKFSIPITVYIQTKNTTSIPLDAWLGCKCEPVRGGLCGNKDFDDDMAKPAPWMVLNVHNTLKLNNAGRAAKKVLAR